MKLNRFGQRTLALILCASATISVGAAENETKLIERVKPLGWGTARECTFAGAVESMTAATDRPEEYAELLAVTGLAYRTRWFAGDAGKPRVAPVTAVGELPDEIHAATRGTGWPLNTVLSFDKTNEAKSPVKRIVASIDAGLPVMCYFSKASGADCAVICGYRDFGKTMLIYSYDGNKTPVAVPLTDLGFLFIFLDKPKDAPFPKDRFLQGLQIAVKNWSRDDHPRFGFDGEFLYGPEAFDRWMTDLSNAESFSEADQQTLMRTSWWNFDTLTDARAVLPEYLRENSSLLTDKAEHALLRAAEFYEQENKDLAKVWQAKDCFFPPSDDKAKVKWNKEARGREQAVLLKAMRTEWHAMDEIRQALKAEKADFASPGIAERDALFDAVKKDDVKAVAAQLDKKPKLINARDDGDGATPLHWAKSAAMAELLLSRAAPIDLPDEYHRATPLWWELSEGRDEAAKVLLAKGAKHGFDILWAAALDDTKVAAMALADEPTCVNDRTSEEDAMIDHGTALHIAAKLNRVQIAKLLIAGGADVNARAGEDGSTPLHTAAWNNKPQVIEALLDGGANMEMKSLMYDSTPLDWAIFAGRAKSVEVLLKHHAKLSEHALEQARGGQRMHITDATAEDFAKVIEMLKAAGAT